MASNAVTYTPPIRRSTRAARPDYEQLEHAHALAEAGKPLEAIQKTFAHLFPSLVVPDLRTTPLTFVQGSSRVTVRLEGEELVITVPLVGLPTGGRAIAALRYVLTRVSATGQLHQPRLRGEAIELEFRSQLAHLHPAKLLEALRKMPFEADATDDWMIGQFGATAIERAPIVPLDPAELARAETFWRTHWTEIEELLKESHRKRSVWFLNELTAFARYRVLLVLPLSGFLLGRLTEASNVFNNTDEDPDKREASLGRFVKEMKALTTAELAANLGHAEYALSPLDDGTPDKILGYLGPGNYMETIGKQRATGKSTDAALALVSTYTFLLATCSWPDEVRAALEQGLEAASGKPWREAASLLWDHARAFADVLGEDAEAEHAEATQAGGADEAAADSYDAGGDNEGGSDE